jgi:pimeloyl-ACP methyl ester carboxylesterase
MIKKSLLLVLLTILLPFYGCNGQIKKELKSENISHKIDTLLIPEIGGIKQVIEIKTDDSNKPILLILSGGPGSSMMNNAETYTNILKNKFTLVQWDQRDAGKTLKLNPSPIQLSVELMGKDTYQVINFLRRQLNQEKIYLLGSSWGNVLGFYIVRNHPELLYSYFAVNPVISQLASEKELLKTLKTYFKENSLANKELTSVNIPFKNDEDLFYLRKWLFYKDGKEYVTSNDFKIGFLQWSKTWSPVWNEVMNIDLPKTLKEVECPIYFFVGKNDIQTSTKITKGYFEKLKAPKKNLLLFENSGHQIHQDEPEKFQNIIMQILETSI